MTSEQALARLIERLEEDQVLYMIVGAMSSNLYGVPRATDDADIVVSFDNFDVVRFSRTLGEGFSLDPQMMMEGFTGSVRHVLHFSPTGFDIELFRLGDDPHHRERFGRRRRQRVPECSREAWVATAEDVVIQKLRWARRKDLDDIVDLIAVSGDGLDWAYLSRWTEIHGTSDLLAQLCREAAG
jgi:hypothetical protein